MNTSLNRRQALLCISQLAAAAVLGACSRSPGQAGAVGDDVELAASVAYDILPFQELPPALYVAAATQLLETGGDGVAAGLGTLRSATSGTPWRELPETRRVEVMESMQDSPFFQSLRAATIQVVLGSAEGRQLVGYGGSAIEHGGYLHRGFNDISWLQAARAN